MDDALFPIVEPLLSTLQGARPIGVGDEPGKEICHKHPILLDGDGKGIAAYLNAGFDLLPR